VLRVHTGDDCWRAEVLVTWGATSLNEARNALQFRVAERVDAAVYTAVDLIRVPTVFLWVPNHLPKAPETVAAYGYWNNESAHYLEIVFFGWLFDAGQPFYDQAAYQHCVNEVRGISKWRPSGDVDFLLLDFEWQHSAGFGTFKFTESIPLPVGKMIAEGVVPNIQVFAQELINHAREGRASDETSPVWQISQKLALDRGRRSLWKWISQTFLKDVGKIYDDVRPYAVCNLAKPEIAPG
jgi:hypothetical protein